VAHHYQQLGFVANFAIAWRTVIGDNDIEDYASEGSSHQILAWIIWLLIVIVGNVIFMNFIIAVVNESYTNCMEKLIATSYQVKVHMIVERESVMSDAEKARKDWFPPYIILRREVDSKTG
jgi:hypothetical protein